MTDPKAAAGRKLDSIVFWSRCTAITTILGVVVLVVAIGYAGLEYWRLKTAMSSAAEHFASGFPALERRP
jgi:hypothetical protein